MGPIQGASATRRALAVGAAFLLGLAGCEAPAADEAPPSSTAVTMATTASSTAPGRPLAWSPCGEAECATLIVPRDYQDPSRGYFELALARRRAQRPDLRIGVLLYARDGPGVAGTAGLVSGDYRFSVDLAARFDIVTWDPRGVNEGAGVDCVDDPDYFRGLDPTPDSYEEAGRLEERVESFVTGCLERSGHLLSLVSTSSSARDIDRLRAALGEEQISYLGVGYGAALGTVYAALFPERVRAMVLDGGYDPSADVDLLVGQGAAARERVLTEILQECAMNPVCYFHNSGEAPTAFEELMAGLEAAPLRVFPFGPVLDEAEAWRAVLFALSDEAMWTRLTMALGEAQAGDGMELLLLSEESVHRHQADPDAAVAIGCLDWPGRGGGATGGLGGDLAEVGARPGTAAAGFLCERWPVDPKPVPSIAERVGTPVLVAAVTGDVLTPLESSRALANALPEGVLLVVEDTRHGAYQAGDRGRACAVAVIDWYLISQILPADGAVCGTESGLPGPPA